MVADGRLSVVDSDTGAWSTAFVKSVAEAEALGPVDLMVVDLPVPDAARLGGAGVPLVVIARDPLDPAAGALADRFPSFGYDTFLREWRPEPRRARRSPTPDRRRRSPRASPRRSRARGYDGLSVS